jgi:hypothetical protein
VKINSLDYTAKGTVNPCIIFDSRRDERVATGGESTKSR